MFRDPLDGRPILVLSPHLDDAVFSAWSLIDRPGSEVWTVFAGIPDEDVVTEWDRRNGYSSGASLIRTRRTEDDVALQGITHRHFDFLERAYTTRALQKDDMHSLVLAVAEWALDHPNGVVAVPAGAGVIMPEAVYQRARKKFSRREEEQAGPQVGATSLEPPQTLRTKPHGAPRALRSGARNLIRRAMHADYLRRRRKTQRNGMLANEDHLLIRDTFLAARERIPLDFLLYEEYPYSWARPATSAMQEILRKRGLHALFILSQADRRSKFERLSAYASQNQLMDPTQRRFERLDSIPVDETFTVIPHDLPFTPRAMHRPAVSVIIPTYNGSQRLPLQLEALATQIDAPPFEVIVVDNGSNDDVAQVAARWSDRLDMTVVLAPAYQGIAYARNVGASYAAASKLAFCDDDDVVEEHWIQMAADATDRAEFVTGIGVEFPAQSFESVTRAREELLKALGRPELGAVGPTVIEGDYPILLGGNCAIRRDCLLKLRGFDLRFDPGAEEKDLVLRYLREGGTLQTASGMQLAVRLRADDRGRAVRTYRHGRMYMLLAIEHGLSKTSPVLNEPPFARDLPRAILATARAALGRRPELPDAYSRTALRCGQVAGWMRYRRAAQRPSSRVGEGLIQDPRPLYQD